MTQIDEKTLGELLDGEVVTSPFFKECPYCGETEIFLTAGKDGCMNCPSCLVSMPTYECNNHIELVHCWNTRTPRTITRDEFEEYEWQVENYGARTALATLGITVEG